ncbi:unnamed protein product [Effrenium voratum]|uniref:Rieske domain-containing protein n=1 Tax=Effrenium voratum TaxID=2562239 RepID=A0AA36NJ86_9DINO|nr:unnamed protein product [Effrenium voratum]
MAMRARGLALLAFVTMVCRPCFVSELPRRSLAAAAAAGSVALALLKVPGPAPASALVTKKPPKPVVAQDKSFQPVEVASWAQASKGQPDLVLGLRGDPYFLLPGKDGGALRNFALRAECTHLGCLANWNRVVNKFVCPCHGSEYDDQGKVLKGPAPQSLALAHVELTETQKVRLVAWTEEDFRDGSEPWWAA